MTTTIILLGILGLIQTVCTISSCEYEYHSTESKSGTFSSPNYPDPYSSNHHCTYRFHGAGKERVQIIIHSLDLNYPLGDAANPVDCEHEDSVVAKTYLNGDDKRIGIYCGSKRPPMLMSSGTSMTVIFLSKATTSSATGFNATYRFVTDFGIKSGKQLDNNACVFEFNSLEALNGTITSPNYPGLYPRETECEYKFWGQYGERVHIQFQNFDVEGISPGCDDDTDSDYLEFSNFVAVVDRKMRRHCGTLKYNFPGEIVSDGAFFRVKFKSNHVYDAYGFEAFYQFRQTGGNQIL